MLTSLLSCFCEKIRQGKLNFTETSQTLFAIAQKGKNISTDVQVLLNQSFPRIMLNSCSTEQKLLGLEQWVVSLQTLEPGIPQIALLARTIDLLKQQQNPSLKILIHTLYAISRVQIPAATKILSTQTVELFFHDGEKPIVFPITTTLEELSYALNSLKYVEMNEKVSALIKAIGQHFQNDSTGEILNPQDICLILEGLSNKENDAGVQNIYDLLIHHIEANHEIEAYFSPQQQEKIDFYLAQQIKSST